MYLVLVLKTYVLWPLMPVAGCFSDRKPKSGPNNRRKTNKQKLWREEERERGKRREREREMGLDFLG